VEEKTVLFSGGGDVCNELVIVPVSVEYFLALIASCSDVIGRLLSEKICAKLVADATP